MPYLHVFTHQHNHRDVERESEKTVNCENNGRSSVDPRLQIIGIRGNRNTSAIHTAFADVADRISGADTTSTAKQHLIGDQSGATVVMVETKDAAAVIPSIVIGHCSTIDWIPDGMSGAGI